MFDYSKINDLPVSRSQGRREWTHEEKVDIVKAFDDGRLKPLKNRPKYTVDPKTQTPLPLSLLDSWRSSYKTELAVDHADKAIVKATEVGDYDHVIELRGFLDLLAEKNLLDLLVDKLVDKLIRTSSGKQQASLQ